MPRDLKQLLADTAARPTRPLDTAGILGRARRQRLALRVARSTIAGALVLLVGLTAVTIMSWRPSGDILLEPGPQRTGPVKDEAPAWGKASAFSGTTNTVLLFDTGVDGVLAVDLDAHVTARQSLDGQRAGDQPYRLWRNGDQLVVGWERIYTVPIASAKSRVLGEATIFVPAAEPGMVWLIDYASRRVEQGATGTYRLVNLDGETRYEGSGVAGHPARGVLGGLALETENGVAILDVAADGVVRRLGTGSGFVADARERTLAWCAEDCAQFHVTDLEGKDQVFAPESGEVFDARSARISPDGRLVAATIVPRDLRDGDSIGAVVLLDTATGQLTHLTEHLRPQPTYLAWSPDGSQLFFSGYSYGALQTPIGRYDLADEVLELATLPVGGALSFIALDRSESAAFLAGARPLPVKMGTRRARIAVPDLQGLTLKEAQMRLVEAGLAGGPMSGPGWTDPDEPHAVVVAQKPPAGTRVVPGDRIGLRTALINPELCAVLRRIPARQGDAHDLTRVNGYWEMLRDARPFADPRFAAYIDQLTAHWERAATLTNAPTRALDSIAIHHDACAHT